MKKAARDLAVLYLLALLGVWALMHFAGGNWWLATTVLFAPRWAFGLPLVLLVPATLFVRFWLTPFYLLHAAVVVYPIMGFVWSSESNPQAGRASLCMITCNVGGGALHVDDMAKLVRANDCDLLTLQECSSQQSESVFAVLGWDFRRVGNMATGSRFALSQVDVIARHSADHYEAIAAIGCELQLTSDATDTTVAEAAANTRAYVINVHLPTLRPGLEKLPGAGFDAASAVEQASLYHRDLSAQVRDATRGGERGKIIAGDFNMPVDGGPYRDHWGDFHNAFSERGFGFGYTKHTSWHGIRIDHVLTDDSWVALSATVGPALGGDHRPVIVKLQRVD